MSKTGIGLLVLIAVAAGVGLQRYVLEDMRMHATDSSMPESADAADERKPLYWVAPMDKNYRRDKPGKSPMGMDLVPVYEEDQQVGDQGGIRISPVVEHNLGVRTAIVEKGAVNLPINTVGYVSFDEDQLTHIHSRVDGWVEVLNVKSAGDPVTRGDALYELYSPALVNAQEEYLAALRSGNAVLLKASAARLNSLGLDRAQVNRLRQRKQVDQRIRVVAQRDGFVTELNVREGMYIKPATVVMSIGTLDTVWVIGEVFERQAGWVTEGLPVTLTTEALPGREWQASVDYLYPMLDNLTRTLRLRVVLDNTDQALKPNMYMNLSLQAAVNDDSLTIPREAVIKSGRGQRVVKSLGDGRYQSVMVKTGVETGDRVRVLSGLNEGDRVVTSAQFLIDSESNIEAEMARMEMPEQTDARPPNTVMTTGKLHAVMADMRMLSITHEPIEAWDWPTMKMDFEVAEGVTIDGLNAGDRLTFEIEKTGDWDYLITSIEGAASNSVMAEETVQSAGKTVMTTGEVRELMPDMNMVEVAHDPIPEWQWPVMTMMFSLAEPADIASLKTGDRIRFRLAETADGDYLIDQIQPE